MVAGALELKARYTDRKRAIQRLASTMYIIVHEDRTTDTLAGATCHDVVVTPDLIMPVDLRIAGSVTAKDGTLLTLLLAKGNLGFLHAVYAPDLPSKEIPLERLCLLNRANPAFPQIKVFQALNPASFADMLVTLGACVHETFAIDGKTWTREGA